MATQDTNLLVGVTGSVASIKLPLLVQSLSSERNNFKLKIITTERARHFYDKDKLTTPLAEIKQPIKTNENAEVEVLGDSDEWARWEKMGDPVLHIELCKWADLFVIAPLDANTLGKLANGLCDNLLTCVFRAWDSKKKPLIFCPAMNTHMWSHPITEEHVSRLVSWGNTVVPPISKKLACGDEGTGAMAEVNSIVDVIMTFLNYRK